MQRSLSVAAASTIRIARTRIIARSIAAAPHRTSSAVPMPSSRLVSVASSSSPHHTSLSSRPFSSVASPAAAPAASSAAAPFQLSPSDKYVVHWRVQEDSEAGGKYQQKAVARKHNITLDERGLYPGGLDSGPSPYDLLASALGGCKSMTVRMYADRKGIRLAPIIIDVMHSKKPAADVAEAQAAQARGIIDLFEVAITVAAPDGDEPLSPTVADSLLAIASRCPVHQTLVGNPRTFIRAKLT